MITKTGWDYLWSPAKINPHWERETRDWVDTFDAVQGLSRRASLGGNLWENYLTLPQRVGELQEEDERNKEILSPEQANLEYPGMAKPAKNPMLRAEAAYYQERQSAEQRLFEGEYTGVLPEWSASLTGGVVGFAQDPISWLAIGTGWGVLSKLGLATKLLNPAHLAMKTWKARGYAAAALGTEAFLTNVIYNTGNKATSELVNRPYATGTIFLNALVAAGLGGVAGAGFPQLALGPAARVHGKATVDFWKMVSQVEEALKSTGSSKPPPPKPPPPKPPRKTYYGEEYRTEYKKEFRDKFLEYLRNNRGELYLDDPFNFWNGDSAIFKQFQQLVDEGKITIATVDDLIKIKEVEVPSAERAFRKLQRQPLTEVYEGFKENANRHVVEVNGYVFKEPKGRFVRTKMFEDVNKVSDIGGAGTGIRGETRFPSLYMAFGERPVNKNKGGEGRSVYMANSPMLAGEIGMLGGPGTVVVGQVETNNLKLLDFTDIHGSTEILKRGGPIEGVKIPRGGFGVLSLRDQARVKLYLERQKDYQGIITDQGHGTPGRIVEIFETAMEDLGRFSTQRVLFHPSKKKVKAGPHIDGMDSKERILPLAVREVQFQFSKVKTKPGKRAAENIYRGVLGLPPEIVSKGEFLTHGDNFVGYDVNLTRGGLVDAILTPAQRRFRVLRPGDEPPPPSPSSPPLPGREGLEHHAFNIMHPEEPRTKTFREILGEIRTPELAGELRNRLKATGFVFDKSTDADVLTRSWILQDNAVIPPAAGKLPLLDAVVLGRVVVPDAKVALLPGIFDIGKHPSLLNTVEREIGRQIAKYIALPDEDAWGGRMLWPRGIFTGGRALPYHLTKGLAFFFGGNVKRVRTVKQIQAAFSDLKSEIGFQAAEGEVATWKPLEGERAAYFQELFSTPVTKDPYHINLLRVARDKMWGDEGKRSLDVYHDRYRSILEDLGDSEIETFKMKELEAQARSQEKEIETLYYGIVKMKEGKLVGKDGKMLASGNVLTAMLRDIPDKPFSHVGGDALEIQSQSMFKKAIMSTMADFLDVLSEQEINFFKAGFYDLSLYKLRDFYLKKDLAKKETSGGKVTDEFDDPKVPEAARKIYFVMRKAMDVSQRMVTDAGVYRRPLGHYIGTASYDEAVIFKGGLGKFRDAIALRTQMPEEFANNFYANVSHKMTGGSRRGDTGTATDTSRAMVFKSPTDESAFMKLYGKGIDRTKFGGGVYAFGAQHTASPLLNGLFSSLENDSKRAALANVFTSHPYEALDIYFHVLRDKYHRAGVPEQDLVHLGRAKDHAGYMIDEYLTPSAANYTGAVKVMKGMRDITTAALLGKASLTAGISDLGYSTTTLSKYIAKDKNIVSLSLDLIKSRLLLLRPTERKKVAHDLFVIGSSTLQQVGLRFFKDEGPTGWTSWLATSSMKLGGLPLVTDIGRTSQALLISSAMSKVLGQSLSQVERNLGLSFQTHGITETDWARISALKDKDIIGRSGSFDYLSLNKLQEELYKAHGPVVGGRIMQNVGGMVSNIADKGIPTQTEYHKAYLGGVGRDPTSFWGGTAAILTQFKLITGAVWSSLADATRPFETGKAATLNWNRVKLAAATTGVLLAWGAFLLQMREMSKGRTPRRMDDPLFWTDSAVVMGIGGIVSDVLQATGPDRPLSAAALGPSLGIAEKGIQLVYTLGDETIQAATGVDDFDWNKLARKGGRFLRTVTPTAFFGQPFIPTVLLNSFFLERWSLLNMETPAQRKRFERWMEKRGQRHFGQRAKSELSKGNF